jgi:Domain of unknown function (DUF4159)/Aerotolerance regulator N-terminal
MTPFAAFAFLSPWWLVGLAGLPILWWLLRVTPPAPRRATFPAIALLLRLKAKEETPAQTPWWLLLLRLVIAALVILALAQPVINPAARFASSGPVLIVVDDNWAAASDWTGRRAAIDRALDQAEREARAAMVLTTAPGLSGEAPRASRLITAAAARTLLGALEPKPWPADRAAALAAIDAAAPPQAAAVFYLGDGLEDPALAPLLERLQRVGPVTYLADPAERRARLLLPPVSEANAIAVTAARPDAGVARESAVLARGDDGRLLARERLVFEERAAQATARLAIPSELRNRIARIELEGEATAGGIALIDERWRRRPVGIVASGGAERQNQPLLADTFYLERALQPFAEVRAGDLAELLGREISVLLLADLGRLSDPERTLLDPWMRRGGVVVRFAGPRLVDADDDFVPVPLRLGGRAFGGAMTWEQPLSLAPFELGSAFAGLDVPEDLRVRRQVLAEPSLDLAQKTWARLTDGTPLVTADKRGEGWLVMIHVTASPEWSNLPLTGLYVEMLRRLLGLAQGIAGDAGGEAVLAPVATLDAFGRLVAPFPAATGVTARALATQTASARTPPGQYGTDLARRALNLGQGVAPPVALRGLPSGVTAAGYTPAREVDFKPPLLVAAFLLIAIDLALALFLRGLVAPGALWRRAASAVLAGLVFAAGSADAQPRPPQARPELDERAALPSALQTRFAYVQTGREDIDTVSRAGLTGLGTVLSRRTAVDAGQPAGVNVERDELSFFPLLYWPIVAQVPRPSDQALVRIKRYLADGGMILFDTREADFIGPTGAGPAALRLREILRPLDLPRLGRVPPEHVLTKAFYLLQDFPGRMTGAPVWVEAPDARDNDGVSSVIVGANDWASAWALDPQGRPMFAAVPGGEGQREQAVRFGVNLVMYALTGNYKADQVHVDAILERLRR